MVSKIGTTVLLLYYFSTISTGEHQLCCELPSCGNFP